MEPGPSNLYSTQSPWAGSSSVLVPVPPFISHAILGRSFLGGFISLLCKIMGCESLLRTARFSATNILGEGGGKEERPERFSSKFHRLWLAFGFRWDKRDQGHLYLEGGLGQGSHPRSVLWEAAEEVLWSPDTLAPLCPRTLAV